ncbi:MAG TPA: 30S ribosomal protein S6 [Lachnospiraceae bacterium]|jgi:small subunit ribosomal protein S6|nr:30S ribosomal protein S6 [Lachnospiraceae bacterium]HAU99777.1 30S ribosomal protein S6 [Lachnospiraceae bacterium]
MSKYELCVVLNAKIEDENRAAELERVKELITRFGGTVTNVDDWGKKRFAYDVQKMKEGYYYFIQFDAETTTPVEIENRVRIMENVVRYLCVKQNEA